MGFVEIIPGVSGGAIAMILGIYERLLSGIARFDSQLVGYLLKGRIADAWRHIDGWFMLMLGGGIVVGLKAFAGVMTYLVEHHTTYTYAAFFGLILASTWLLARMVNPQTPAHAARCLVIGVLTTVFTFWLMSRGVMAPQPGLLYTFICGLISVVAMILPGISGSYLLLLMGKYVELSGLLHRAPMLTIDEWLTILVFVTGCFIGIVASSRFLKWLLAHYWSGTMAALTGFTLGSLYRIWPFQQDLSPEIAETKFKLYRPVWPEVIDQSVWICLAIGVAAFTAIVTIDLLARRIGHSTDEVAKSFAGKAAETT